MALDMNLPRNTQPGDQVELTFVSNQPRLTFALTRDLPAANRQQSSGRRQAASHPQRFGALSRRTAAKKISDQAEAQATADQTRPLRCSLLRHPISRSLPPLCATLCPRAACSNESHQAQWVAGERKLTDLLQEPQGKLSALIPGVGAEVAQKTLHYRCYQMGFLRQSASRMPVHAEAVTLFSSSCRRSIPASWCGKDRYGRGSRWNAVEERNAREGGVGDVEMPHWRPACRPSAAAGWVMSRQTLAIYSAGPWRIDLKAADAGTAESDERCAGQTATLDGGFRA